MSAFFSLSAWPKSFGWMFFRGPGLASTRLMPTFVDCVPACFLRARAAAAARAFMLHLQEQILVEDYPEQLGAPWLGSSIRTPIVLISVLRFVESFVRLDCVVIPDPTKIRSFRDVKAFEAWLRVNHASEPELWLKIHKKSSGLPSLTHDQAIDAALCWGWIDGLRKGFDQQSFLQRFTPRKPKSVWSQINRDRVARLIAAGRMTPYGERHINAAKVDGRWDAAYAPIRSASQSTTPKDLRAAIEANPRALKTFRTLSRANLFALAFRTNNMRTPEGRKRKIASLVAMLSHGQTIVPQSEKKDRKKKEEPSLASRARNRSSRRSARRS